MPRMMKIAWRGGFKHGVKVKHGVKGKRKLGHSTLVPDKASQSAFMRGAVLPLRKLAMHGIRMTNERKDVLIGELRSFATEPARPVGRRDALCLLKMALFILRKARGRGHALEVEQLERSVANLKDALCCRRHKGMFGRIAGIFRDGRFQKAEHPACATGELGKAAHAVVKAATVVVQFINCHDMKVSVSDRDGETRVVVEGPGGGGSGGSAPSDRERLRKTCGVSCPYVIDEKKNTIAYKSNGHDKRQSKVYRIPLGAASAAVNALVKGMEDGIRAGKNDWYAPFTGHDAKALGRETNLDNQAFLHECVIRARLKGKGNQTYANSAQLYHYGMRMP